MASSQHVPSYTGSRPPLFASEEELYQTIESLIELGLLEPYLDPDNQLRFALFVDDQPAELLSSCGTLAS